MRVLEKKKNKNGKPYNCGQCQEKIKAGESYFEWSFFRGSTHRQHTSHGRPRQSQLTQSKMRAAYSAMEDLEDAITELNKGNATIKDLAESIRAAADGIAEARDDHQEGYDNMPPSLQESQSGQDLQEKIDALDGLATELESAASDVEGMTSDGDDEDSEDSEDKKAEAAERAQEALDSFSL